MNFHIASLKRIINAAKKRYAFFYVPVSVHQIENIMEFLEDKRTKLQERFGMGLYSTHLTENVHYKELVN